MDNNIICERCKRVFSRKCHLANHLSRKIKCKTNGYLNKLKNTNKCDYCGKLYARDYNLIKHLDKYCKVKKNFDNRNDDFKDKVCELNNDIEDLLNDIEDLTEENKNLRQKRKYFMYIPFINTFLFL